MPSGNPNMGPKGYGRGTGAGIGGLLSRNRPANSLGPGTYGTGIGIGGLLSARPAQKGPTQYGPGTEIGGRAYGNALLGTSLKVQDWDKAGKLAQKIALDQALVGLALDQARLGKTFSVTPYTGKTPIKSKMIDPFKMGVIAHWTGGIKPTKRVERSYHMTVDPLGNLDLQRTFTPAGLSATAHTKRAPEDVRQPNLGNFGVSSIGLGEPNAVQLAAGRNIGSFVRGINPSAQITSHGYLAGDMVKAGLRSVPAKSRRQGAEGKNLAAAIAGQPISSIGGFAPSRQGPYPSPLRLPRISR